MYRDLDATYAEEFAADGPLTEDLDVFALHFRACVAIRCGTAGTLCVLAADLNRPLTFHAAEGETVHVQATKVLATTTCEKLIVYWP